MNDIANATNLHQFLSELLELKQQIAGYAAVKTKLARLRKRDKQVRQSITNFMQENDLSLINNIEGKYKISRSARFKASPVNREFLISMFEQYIKEKGNKLDPTTLADFVFERRKRDREKVSFVHVRELTASQKSLELDGNNDVTANNVNASSVGTQPKPASDTPLPKRRRGTNNVAADL